MGRIILYLLLLLALGLTFERSREVILDVSEPVRSAVVNPFYRWMTTQQMGRIIDDLRDHEAGRGSLPVRPAEFDEWLNNRYRQANLRTDSWGTRYRLQVSGNLIRIISAGPDREFGTDDDMVREGSRTPIR